MLTALLFASLLPLASGGDTSELGLELVPWSKKVGDRRYESARDFDATVKFFRDRFKGSKSVKWSREVSLPAVKYIHLENLTESSKWQGVNVYALPDGRVRYFILARDAAAPSSSKVELKDRPTRPGKSTN